MTAARMKVCPSCNGYGETGFPEATSVYTRSDGWYPCPRCEGAKVVAVTVEDELAEAQDEVERLRNALTCVLPMAKGYAAVHPVGRNAEKIAEAEAALAPKEGT